MHRRDVVTFRIGQIAQAAIEVDAAARDVWAVLKEHPHKSGWDAPRHVSTTLQEIGKALSASVGLPENVRTFGSEAVQQALDAYAERSRYLHDVLVHSSADSWRRVHLDRRNVSVAPEEIEVRDYDMEECRLLLTRSRWRLVALRNVIEQLRAGEEASVDSGSWIFLLSNNFTVDEDGSASWASPDDD